MSSTIPEGAKWLPEPYMDEVCPPGRPTPGDWIIQSPDGKWALASGWDDGEHMYLTEGEVVEFHASVEIASPNLTIDFDADGARIWHSDPAGPFTAPPGFDLSVYDGENLWAGLDDAAYELDEGEHQLEVYAWTSAARKFRFTDGRFEPVRQDA